MVRPACAAGGARDRRPDQDQPACPQISPDGRGRDAGGAQIGLWRGGRPSRSQLQPPRPDPHRRATPFSSISGRARTSSRCWRMSTTTSSNSTASTTWPCAPIRRPRGKRVSFNAMSAQTGIVPVKGALFPVLVTFADPANPGTARARGAGRRRSGAREGLSPPGNHRRGGAERILAARFRRRAGRARHARNRGETAVAERRRRFAPPRRSGRPDCPGSTAIDARRLSRENSRAAPLSLCGY